MAEQWTENPFVSGSNPLMDISMKQSGKVKLFNKINNLKLIGAKQKFKIKNVVYLCHNHNVIPYLEILYKEGKIFSYRIKNNVIFIIVNEGFNIYNEKIALENVKNRPSLKYKDIVRIRPLLKTTYFHTNSGGLQSIYDLKKEKRGGVPSFYI